MSKILDIKSVRSEVVRHKGAKVKVRANHGRNKVDITEGVITQVYPSIFLIQTEATAEIPKRTLSFSYNDVISRDIELVVSNS